MADKIRVGVIGAGGIFRSLHQPYYEMADRAQVVAVADVREEAAQEVAAKFGATAYGDYRALLECNDVDAVDVCVHPRPHCDITVAAAQTGKHILMEKPLCRSVAEADRMIAAARAANVQLQVAYMLPFHPVYQQLKQLLSDGTLGAPHLIYCNQVGWFPPHRHPWLFIREESGGMLVEQAIHNFDAWLYLYGAVSSVYARTSHVPLGGTYPEPAKAVENNATVVVNFQSGAVGTLLKSWAAEVGHHGEGVVCAKGSASYSEGTLRWKTHTGEAQEFKPTAPDDDTYRNLPPETRERRYWSYASKGASIEHWLRCIAGEETPRTSGEVGRAGIEVAEAAYRSAQSGQPVVLPLDRCLIDEG